MIENQNTEFKKIWKDEYIKWISGFANAQGGSLYIGLNDNGDVVGIDNYKKLLDDLPNKIRDILGVTAEINHHNQEEKHYLEIVVEPYSTPISYKGQFYYRSGSTLQELKGPSLEKFLLKKIGKSWDEVEADGYTYDDLSNEAFDILRKNAKLKGRIPSADLELSNIELLDLLRLKNDNTLNRASLILFGKDPEKMSTGAFLKIGYFKTDYDLLFQDVISGSLFNQVEKTMDLLTTKYLKAYISYDGINRVETLEYPVEALREAVLNALIHKDYSSNAPIQISIYSDHILIWNPGKLPDEISIEKLRTKHSSIPANPNIAKTFFRAGYIESWGRGTVGIIEKCIEAKLPEPTFEENWGGIAVTFNKEKHSEIEQKSSEKSSEKTSVKTSGKTSGKTSVKILELVQENSSITIPDLANKIGVTERSIERNIAKLKETKKLKRIGPDKGGYWKVLD